MGTLTSILSLSEGEEALSDCIVGVRMIISTGKMEGCPKSPKSYEIKHYVKKLSPREGGGMPTGWRMRGIKHFRISQNLILTFFSDCLLSDRH